MDEFEGEIEYLDEDEELVQQCVHYANETYLQTYAISEIPIAKNVPLCLQKEPTRLSKRRRKPSNHEENDSDYEPDREEAIEEEAPPVKTRSRTTPKSQPQNKPALQSPKKKPALQSPLIGRPRGRPLKTDHKTHSPVIEKRGTVQENFLKRRDMEVLIPDYDDPLCLPVRVISRNNRDRFRLQKWNDLCLRYYKRYRDIQNDVISSTRSVFLKCDVNGADMRETTVYGRVTVLDKNKQNRVDEFRGILPNYRELKLLKFGFAKTPESEGLKETSKTVSTVIISKQTTGDEENIVTYNPHDAITAVYTTTIEKADKDNNSLNAEMKHYIKEKAICRMCPSCYQLSHREPVDNVDKNMIPCAVCNRNFTSAYNLLSHVKTHATPDVLSKQTEISKALAQVMDYHYNCRICVRTFDSIKHLRRHIKQHLVSESFHCEVCNQDVKA